MAGGLSGDLSTRRTTRSAGRASALRILLILVATLAATSAAPAQSLFPGSAPQRVGIQRADDEPSNPGDEPRDKQDAQALALLPPERQLLQLRLREQELLELFGPDHPEVISVRARMDILREFLACQPGSVQPITVPTSGVRPAAQAEVRAHATPCAEEVPPPPLPIRVVEPPPPLPAGIKFNPWPEALPAWQVPLPPPSPTRPRWPPVVNTRREPIKQKIKPAAPTESPAPITPPQFAERMATETLALAAPPVYEQQAEQSLLAAMLVQLLAFLPAVAMGVLLHLGVLLFLLRRYGARLAPLLRVEVVNVPATGTVEPTAGIPGRAGVPSRVPEVGGPLALHRDPSYARELRRPAEDDQQQEAAVLRQIFEQNLRLREQLGELQCTGV